MVCPVVVLWRMTGDTATRTAARAAVRAAAERALALTDALIEQFGPRPAGSEGSRRCAEALCGAAEPTADRARVESFTVHPGAFLGWIRVLVVIYAASVAALWFANPLVAALLVTAGLVVMVAEFFLYREALDPFFPRATGWNVLASVDPVGELRGELIVSGHHDSARVFNFLIHQPRLYPVRVFGGIGSLVLLWFASRRHTPGAGDNLASSAAALEALREVADARSRGEGLDHLRVTFASWDAEECGLRGARAWRRSQPAAAGHPVWNLNLECLYDTRDFFLLASDINGSVPLSEALAQRCSMLLADAGYPGVPVKPIAFLTGGTDAAETARGGAHATTLMGMPWGNTTRSAVYHTPLDTIDTVSEDALSSAVSLALALARSIDTELAAPTRG